MTSGRGQTMSNTCYSLGCTKYQNMWFFCILLFFFYIQDRLALAWIYNLIMLLMGYFTQKRMFCHLLILMFFQTFMTYLLKRRYFEDCFNCFYLYNENQWFLKLDIWHSKKINKNKTSFEFHIKRNNMGYRYRVITELLFLGEQ